MQNSKLIAAIRQLEPEAIPRFKDFVESPYFNKRPALGRLLDFLLQFAPDYEDERLQKTAAYAFVFPGEPYEDKPMRYHMSWLNQLLEQFWLHQRQEAEQARNYSLLMEALSDRGLDKSYRQRERQLSRLLQKTKVRDAAYFRQRQGWADAREKHFQRKRLRQFNPDLQRASDALDRYYYLEKMKYACAMLDRQAILQGDYTVNITPEWLAYLEAQDYFGLPLLRLYVNIFKALSAEEEAHYFDSLLIELDSISASTSVGRLREIYFMAINYCARKIRQGKALYVTQALSLYTKGIDRGVLMENGELSPWTFTNVVKLALRLKRYAWIEQFMEQKGALLPEAFRENALHYNYAELYYYTEQLSQAQVHLTKVAYTDLNYYLGARTQLAKIYYEQGEEEALLSLIAAFTIFLKRNREASGDIKQTFLNFCEILYQIVRHEGKKLEPLGQRIEDTRLLADRSWLMQAWASKWEPKK